MAKEEEKKGEGGEKEIEREDVEEQLKKIKEEVLRERERRTQQKKNDSPWVGVIFVVYCLGLLGVCWWLGGVLEREGWFVEMGGGGGGGERKTDDKRYQLQVPLEDVFNQEIVSFEAEKVEICNRCHGTGLKQQDPPHCPVCQGRGVQYRTVRLYNGQSFKREERCGHCGGTGVHPEYICPVCEGHRHVRSRTTHSFSLPPGVQDGQIVVLEGESDEYVGHQPGDVQVELYIKKHRFFEKDGDSLVYNLTVLLKESLLGFDKTITQLNGEGISVKSTEVVGPGEEIILEGGGLPKEGGGRGELRVRMKVDYRKNRFLSKTQKEQLIEFLGEEMNK